MLSYFKGLLARDMNLFFLAFARITKHLILLLLHQLFMYCSCINSVLS